MQYSHFDVVIAGAGIVGLATAYDILQRRPGVSLAVVDKEASPAFHQTGRNSGVIHSGLYYKPGSLKATTCRAGRLRLVEFCNKYSLPMEMCGKLVVACSAEELPRLNRLEELGRANGVAFDRLGEAGLKEIEPHCAGREALHVHDTGIVDYIAVCNKLVELIKAQGEVRFSQRVLRVEGRSDRVSISTQETTITADVFVNCCGLQCDRVMHASGVKPAARIVPFRGDYYELTPDARRLCKHLIYPVPDPAFPFLGVHLTRMTNGSVECGPNAVLAFAREGYRLRDVNLKDLCGTLTYPGFLKLARKHVSTGATEMWRSISRRAFANAVRRLVPELEDEQLVRAPAGVRAQAVSPAGQLVDDFLIEQQGRTIHVNNAPSPAATASLEIGHQIADKVLNSL